MSDVGEWVRTREPLADTFETVVEFEGALNARFLADFIFELSRQARIEGYVLLLDGVATGSIRLRWKLGLASIFSAGTLSIAANGAQVADFMDRAWKSVTGPEQDRADNQMLEIIARGIADGRITSITFRQAGGSTLRIDATTTPAPPSPDIYWKYFFNRRWGSELKTEAPWDPGPSALIGGQFGFIRSIAGELYFQLDGRGPIYPLIDRREQPSLLIADQKYFVRGILEKGTDEDTAFILTDAKEV